MKYIVYLIVLISISNCAVLFPAKELTMQEKLRNVLCGNKQIKITQLDKKLL